MGNPMRLAAAGMLALSLVGCAKGSAESAIAAAESAVNAVKDEATKVSPNELKAITDTIAALKAKVAAGDYQPALMGARTATSMARDLAASVSTRKVQLTTSFTTLAAEMPKQMAAVTAKVTELAAMRKLPAGVDAARVATLKTEVGTWDGAWKAATDAFASGNLSEALTKGNEVKAKVAQVMAMFGMK